MDVSSSSGSKADVEGGPVVLSVILATFNERENLPGLLDRLFAVGLPPTELVIVDDGSTDGTREYLAERARSDPRLRLVWHEGKQTTLRAQCQGIELSKGRYVIVLDADLQHPPEILPVMVRALEDGAALVVGSRYAPGGSAGPRTLGRLAISRGAETTAKFFLAEARSVADPVSGLFGFRREIYRPLPPGWRGYKLLLFLLVMSRGQMVAEVGYQFEPRAGGSSKVTQNWRFIRYFLIEVLLARKFGRSLWARGPRARAAAASAQVARNAPGSSATPITPKRPP